VFIQRSDKMDTSNSAQISMFDHDARSSGEADDIQDNFLCNEHVDKFIREWCSVTDNHRNHGYGYENFVDRLCEVRSGEWWLYSPAEVSASSYIFGEGSTGYVGVGELHHFICLCKFLASSEEDRYLTSASFRRKFANDLAFAAYDTNKYSSPSKKGSGKEEDEEELSIYIPPMSSTRFLDIYDNFDTGVGSIPPPPAIAASLASGQLSTDEYESNKRQASPSPTKYLDRSNNNNSHNQAAADDSTTSVSPIHSRGYLASQLLATKVPSPVKAGGAPPFVGGDYDEESSDRFVGRGGAPAGYITDEYQDQEPPTSPSITGKAKSSGIGFMSPQGRSGRGRRYFTSPSNSAFSKSLNSTNQDESKSPPPAAGGRRRRLSPSKYLGAGVSGGKSILQSAVPFLSVNNAVGVSAIAHAASLAASSTFFPSSYHQNKSNSQSSHPQQDNHHQQEQQEQQHPLGMDINSSPPPQHLSSISFIVDHEEEEEEEEMNQGRHQLAGNSSARNSKSRERHRSTTPDFAAATSTMDFNNSFNVDIDVNRLPQPSSSSPSPSSMHSPNMPHHQLDGSSCVDMSDAESDVFRSLGANETGLQFNDLHPLCIGVKPLPLSDVVMLFHICCVCGYL
jgi:hypothetical protein